MKFWGFFTFLFFCFSGLADPYSELGTGSQPLRNVTNGFSAVGSTFKESVVGCDGKQRLRKQKKCESFRDTCTRYGFQVSCAPADVCATKKDLYEGMKACQDDGFWEALDAFVSMTCSVSAHLPNFIWESYYVTQFGKRTVSRASRLALKSEMNEKVQKVTGLKWLSPLSMADRKAGETKVCKGLKAFVKNLRKSSQNPQGFMLADSSSPGIISRVLDGDHFVNRYLKNSLIDDIAVSIRCTDSKTRVQHACETALVTAMIATGVMSAYGKTGKVANIRALITEVRKKGFKAWLKGFSKIKMTEMKEAGRAIGRALALNKEGLSQTGNLIRSKYSWLLRLSALQGSSNAHTKTLEKMGVEKEKLKGVGRQRIYFMEWFRLLLEKW